jgi:predicted metalloprotease
MTTVINNPGGSSEDGGAGVVIGAVITIVILVILFFVFGLPIIRNRAEPTTNIIKVEIPTPVTKTTQP